MGRYQKFHSNYTLRKRHQTVKGGVITERDWVTLGERFRFGPNKRAMYADGNFLFTSSNVAPSPNRKKNYTTTNAYKYNDVEYSTDDVNTVAPNINTNDIRTFAYFGSCVELVRAAVEAIVAEFPACITLSSQQLTYYDATNDEFYPVPTVEGEPKSGEGCYLLNNPFGIDLHHKDVTLDKYDNPYRFLSASYTDYTINGETIIGYDISEWLCNYSDDCNCRYDKILAPVLEITIKTENNNEYTLYGYLVDSDIFFTYCGEEFVLKPNDDAIEAYFNGLKGFEKQLLNRKTTPLYKNSFITPIMGELNYQYVERTYTWPLMSGSDYCIDIDSMSYTNFISSLVDLATTMDELWTDNLYERMTHEAIKNFDWTYTREFAEGEEEDKVNGGERMKKILHIFARLMDDCKRYADAIQYANKVSYCGYDDMPNAVLSDKLGYQGWDVVSTIPTLTDEDGEIIDLDNVTIDKSALDNWFPTVNSDEVTPSYVDIDFSRRLLLSSAHIWRTKGTKYSIEMVMGMFGFKIDDDYALTEQYYTVEPKKYYDDKVVVTIPADPDDPTSKEKSESYDFGPNLVEVNQHKGLTLSSEDEFSGIPVKQLDFIELDDATGKPKKDDDGNYIYESYIIPYFDQSKYEDNEPYDGYLYFQQKGGWGKTLGNDEEIWSLTDAEKYDDWRNGNSEEEIDTDYYPKELNSHIGYKETISYLHVVSRVNDLLNVNSRSVNGGDIYYVVNLDDFMNYYEVTKDESGTSDGGFNCDYVTHFFMFRYTAYDASVFTSWMNVSLTVGENEYDGNIAKKVEYLDGLMTTTFGNNPHSGYGNYDCGIEFLEYLKNPFKYALDNYTITGTDENGVLYSERGESTTFDIEGPIDTNSDNDKIEIVSEGNKKTNEYINSKVLIMENKVKGENDSCKALTLYTDYFFNVMLPYVMQVIPSTTILVLKGFDCSCNLSITEFHYGNETNKNTISSSGGTINPTLVYELNGVVSTAGKAHYEITSGEEYVTAITSFDGLEIDENKGATERTITVEVTVTYSGDQCAEAVSDSAIVTITQEAATIEERLSINKFTYNDGSNVVPINADAYDAEINYIYQRIVNGNSDEPMIVKANSEIFTVTDGSSFVSVNSSNGTITVLENTAPSERTATISVEGTYVSDIGTTLTASGSVTIMQKAADVTIEYENPKIVLSCSNFSADGDSTQTVQCTITQEWKSSDGNSGTITEFTDSQKEWVLTNASNYTLTFDESTLQIHLEEENTTTSEREICILTLTVNANGKSNTESITIYQNAGQKYVEFIDSIVVWEKGNSGINYNITKADFGSMYLNAMFSKSSAQTTETTVTWRREDYTCMDWGDESIEIPLSNENQRQLVLDEVAYLISCGMEFYTDGEWLYELTQNEGWKLSVVFHFREEDSYGYTKDLYVEKPIDIANGPMGTTQWVSDEIYFAGDDVKLTEGCKYYIYAVITVND